MIKQKSEVCFQTQHLIMCEWCELVVPSSSLASHMRNSHPDAPTSQDRFLTMMRKMVKGMRMKRRRVILIIFLQCGTRAKSPQAAEHRRGTSTV